MSIRKTLCSAAGATLLLFALAGCASGGTAGTTASTPAPEQSTQEPVTQAQPSEVTSSPVAVEVQGLPSEYWITYEMENGDGTISRITMAKDSEGNLYFQNGEEELWFLTDGSGYVQAMPDEDGILSPVSTGTILKESAVQKSTAAFWDCVETSDKLIAPGFSHAGTTTVAERACDLYTQTMGVAGLNVTYNLYIDQETGICMGWTEDKETGIFDSDPSEGTFLCAEFQTDSVVLPNLGS